MSNICSCVLIPALLCPVLVIFLDHPGYFWTILVMFPDHPDLRALLPGHRVAGGHSYRETLAVGLPVALGHWGPGLDWTGLEALGHWGPGGNHQAHFCRGVLALLAKNLLALFLWHSLAPLYRHGLAFLMWHQYWYFHTLL